MPLDPAAAEILALLDAAGSPLAELDHVTLREGYAAGNLLASHPDVVPATEDRTVPGPGGDVPVRIYRPEAPGPLPVVVYAHGGGWVIGDVDTHDGVCEHLAAETPALVVSVDYRRAPEDPFPAAVEDMAAAVRWVADHAAELGGDPDRLAVAGDSAGGNLAAVTALAARDAGGPAIAFQLLVYPVTDCTMTQPSYTENGEGYMLTAPIMAWFVDAYLGGADPLDPRVSPLWEDDLTGLPPALVITAEFDPLRDEGEAYAARLAEAGVEVTVTRYDGMIHGFASMGAALPAGKDALAQAAAALRAALA